MFNKKKDQIQVKPPVNYSNWADDLGFLFFVLERKKNMVKSYIINTLSDQLDSNDYLQDEMLRPRIEDCVADTMLMLSDSYLNYLLEKYFKNKDELVKFISEDVYNDLTRSAIERNFEKINKKVIENNLKIIQGKNNATR